MPLQSDEDFEQRTVTTKVHLEAVLEDPKRLAEFDKLWSISCSWPRWYTEPVERTTDVGNVGWVTDGYIYCRDAKWTKGRVTGNRVLEGSRCFLGKQGNNIIMHEDGTSEIRPYNQVFIKHGAMSKRLRKKLFDDRGYKFVSDYGKSAYYEMPIRVCEQCPNFMVCSLEGVF